jgi:P27 family predicted phage terminase small subunit
MPGPKPKPTALKLLQGNPGHQKLPQNEPKMRPLLPDMPPYLGRLARKRWRELLPELDYGGVLSRVDGEVLAGYCQAYEQVCRLTAELEANGRTYTVGTNGAQSARPEVAMLNRAWDDIRKFGAELGIGAASRSKIEVKKPDDAHEDPVAKAVAASARRR